MGRNPSWPDVNATFFRSSLAWKLPAGTVTFASSTSSTYEAIGTVSGMQPASNGRFVTVRMRSDAVYNISFDVPENKTMPLYDSSGYLLDVNKNSLGLYLESYNPTQIKSFKPEYSGLYYISIVSSSRTDNAFLALTVTEDIGGDSKNTPETVVDSGRPIYRFFNMSTGTHFFTSSEGERDNIYKNFNNFSYEGPAFNAATATTSDPITVYRFFNKRTGTHFFTSSEGERDNVIANSSDTYSFEGEAYKALSSDSTNPNAKSLYRFFNKTNGTHFYTASEVERDSIIKTSSATYNFEGVAYKVLDSTVPPAGAPMAQAVAMPPQGEAALQAGVVDAAPTDLTAAIGGLQAADPQPVTFGAGAVASDSTGGFAGLFPQQRSDWAAMFAA